MKKGIWISILIIILTGCQDANKNVESTYQINYNDDYYNIYMPYKKGVANNYLLTTNVVDFDVNTIEKNLIQISSNEFDIHKYYYQEGQYLKEKDLKKLLNKEHLNKTNVNKIDGKKVNPTFIAGIFEKNFLNKSGDLSGISLGIVLNPFQSYDSNNNYVEYDKDKLIEFAHNSSIELIKYLRDEKNIKDIPILVALYVEQSPNKNISGDYLFYGITNSYDLQLNKIDQKKYYMNNSNVKKMDKTSYDNFQKLKDNIHNYDSSIYVSGLGYFSSDKLMKLDIIITKNHYTYGELMYISQLISENILKYYSSTKVVVDIKAINELQAYVAKEENQTSTDIFIY